MEEVDGEDEEESEELEFDVQSHDGRLPGSSYTAEETLFTWADVTGIAHQSGHHSSLLTELPFALPPTCCLHWLLSARSASHV